MKRDDAEEFTQSLGQIVGGSWRQIALAKRLGVPQALGLSIDAWVNQRLGGYIRMSVEDRRKAVEELKAEGQSTREIGELLGVDHSTVVRDAGANAPNSAQEPVETGANAPLDAVAALAAIAPREATPHVAQNSGNNEWYTPAPYVTAAAAVMGSIDLDPASSDLANRTVGAARYFTKESDGLAQQWTGAVWMNPPYAQPHCANFCAKLVEEVDAGNTTQACVLVNNATDTQWFQSLLSRASAVCFVSGRVRFVDRHGDASGAPLQGQAVLYVGTRPSEFAGRFQHFGQVLLNRNQRPETSLLEVASAP